MAQFGSTYEEFTKRHAAVVFIAAQKIEGLFRGKEHVQKKKYPFPILFDETREVSRAYGVYQAFGIDTFNIARRATFVIGGEGRICWIAVSPQQREGPAIADIFSAIESCGKY
jgi:methyl-accepting chemotaxis protein